MNDKFDYKKEYKDLYIPKRKPMIIEVPTMNFIMVDGEGMPGSKGCYASSIFIILYN